MAYDWQLKRYSQKDRYISTWAEFVSKIMGDPEKATALADEAMKEVRRGAAIHCPMWVWIAQKSHRSGSSMKDMANALHTGLRVRKARSIKSMFTRFNSSAPAVPAVPDQ